MRKTRFLKVYIMMFQNKNIFLRNKVHKFRGSLTAQGLTSCPFMSRFVAFPSEWAKNVAPMSLDTYQCVYVWISFGFWFCCQCGLEVLAVFCRKGDLLLSAHNWIKDLWEEKLRFSPLGVSSKVTNVDSALLVNRAAARLYLLFQGVEPYVGLGR